MVPTLVPKPFHRDGWCYEEKIDGYRMLAYKDGARVRLVSRNDVDHTGRYPDVAETVARLRAPTLVLDAELAVFDAQLRSRFDWLRHRQPEAIATPPVLIAFVVQGLPRQVLRGNGAWQRRRKRADHNARPRPLQG